MEFTEWLRAEKIKFDNAPESEKTTASAFKAHVDIGLQDRADKLERALDICSFEEKKLVITGRNTGATCQQFGDYVMQTLAAL